MSKNNSSSGPAPQLARPVYNLDSDDDSDDDSLEIMPQVNPSKMTASSVMSAATAASLASQPSPPTASEASSKPPSPAALSNARLMSMNFSDSDSDSDDSFMKKYNLKRTQPVYQPRNLSQSTNKYTTSQTKKAATKPTTKSTKSRNSPSAAEKEEKQRERQRIREAKAQQKKAEQEARAKQRAVDKENRQLQKQQEKDTKKRQRQEFQQMGGKFAHQEIALLVDLPIYLDEELDLTNSILTEDFLMRPQPVTYHIPKSIQWIRKDYLNGGAKDALEKLEQKKVENFERSPYLLIMMGPTDFLPLLNRVGHEVDDNYPALEQYVLELQAKYRRSWKNTEDAKIIFLLREVPETLDKQWKNKKGKQSNNGPSLPTEWELDDAIQWLLIQFQVEVIHCSSVESIHTQLHKLTRGICEAPYQNNVTELECIKKLKSVNNGERLIDRAQDSWFRQLQQLKGLSEAGALRAVQAYPTLHSLWNAYSHGEDNNNSLLMADSLCTSRSLSKLSHHLYRVLKSNDPQEKLT